MKTSFVLMLFLMCFAESHGSTTCSVLRFSSSSELEVETNEGKSTRVWNQVANAIYYQPGIFLVPDHALGGANPKVRMLVPLAPRPGSGVQSINTVEIEARVVARDFHTDLALLELTRVPDSANLRVCRLSVRKVSPGSAVLVGVHGANRTSTSFDANVINGHSENLEVPGFLDGLEADIGVHPPGFSGGALMVEDEVTGIVNAISGHVIVASHAADVRPVALRLHQEFKRKSGSASDSHYSVLDRNYTFDYFRQAFIFSDLSVRGIRQIKIEGSGSTNKKEEVYAGGGTVHTFAGGTVHTRQRLDFTSRTRSDLYGGSEFNNVPVGMSVGGLGYVVAEFDRANLTELRRRHPELVDRLSNSVGNSLWIHSVENTPTPNVLELLRALATSSPDYKLTGVMTRYLPKATLEGDLEMSIRDASLLIQSISDRENVSRDMKSGLYQKFKDFIDELSRLRSFQLNYNGVISEELANRCRKIWESLDSSQDEGLLFRLETERGLTTQERELRDAIRVRAPLH